MLSARCLMEVGALLHPACTAGSHPCCSVVHAVKVKPSFSAAALLLLCDVRS